MSVREKYLKDYGISEEESKKILAICKNATGYEQHLLLHAAQSVYPEIAKFLFINLTTGIGYDNISKTCYIPMQRKDFQGYRRKTMYRYYELLKLHGKF